MAKILWNETKFHASGLADAVSMPFKFGATFALFVLNTTISFGGNMKFWLYLVLALGLCPSFSTLAATSWRLNDSPARFADDYEYRLDHLPKDNILPPSQIPWSETYWARYLGSINIRWNAPGRPGFGYHSPTKREVQAMSREQLAQLAPTEKYDLVMGHYDYPMKNFIAQNYANSDAKDWEGICDGWAIAATQKLEPRPVDVANPDGIVIPFGSSDVKALMSFYAIKVFDSQRVSIGTWCGRRVRDCPGINAGTYHVVLANELGIRKKSFAVNISRTHEIWNQPVYGFQYEIVGSALSHDAFAAVRVKSKMFYTDELDNSEWEPVTGTDKWKGDVFENEYVLELDREGKIVGGYWINGEHPQLFWKTSKEIIYEGAYDGLNKIYQPIKI